MPLIPVSVAVSPSHLRKLSSNSIEKKMKMVPAVNPKIPLEDSFKRQGGIIQLEAIKEDRGDDDYCKYNDDFEPQYPE